MYCFMIFFTLLYLFTIKLINAEKNPIFELTESDPAFAFHGVRLNQAETITIKTSVASNFEIIYSQAGCTNHNKGMCDDTIPFNISLADSLLIGTDSRNCSDLSTSEILVTLYIWVYNVDQRTELTFNKTSSESIFEFAVSIRVREWIDESMSLLLIPGIQGGNHKNSIGIIVLETEIVTVVANPNTYDLRFHSRTTATTIFTYEPVKFCLLFESQPDAENLDKFNFWTPYYYPWIFDQQLQVEMLRKTGKTAQTFIAVQTKTSRTSREIQLEIVKIDGITLYLTAHPTNDGDFECGKVNTFYKSYSTEKATVPIVPPAETFEAYCLNITWTFNSSLFESTSPIGFMLKLTAKPLIRTFELTKRTPSFAIHGDRLMQFEQIEITYHNCTGVIVDWTIDECQQPNGTLCLDPSPFKVDGSIWDMPELFLSLKENSDRVEWASQVDHQIKGVFWTNFLPQPAEGDFGSVTLSSSQNYGRSVTYAVSVRVPDWIKETKKVLLIPGMSTGNEKRNTIDDPLTNATKFDYLIVKGNVTATIIPHPDNYAWYGPWSIMRSINRVPPFSPQKNCQAFKDSQTLSPNCPDKTIFESYAGAEPGLDRLDEHRLASGRADFLRVDSTSTATSIFTDEQCRFCLEFDMDRKKTWPYSTMNRMLIFSMPYHPWVFDNKDKEIFAMNLSSCFPLLGNTFGYPTNSMTSFTGKFEQLTGGNFTFKAYPTNSADNYCSSRSPTYAKSFTPTSDMVEFTFRGNCIASSFCPDLSLNESLGFMLKITEEPRTFQLDLQTPSFAIHGARLSTFFAIEISTNVSVNFLIDITQNDCKNKRDNAGEEICDDLLPILIDDDSLAFVIRTKIPFGSIADNGTFGYFYKSQHKLEHKLVFLIRHNPDVDFLEYGISIRVEEWINENKSVLVIPGIENQGDDFYIMIQEDVIATVVDSPTTDKETPWSPLISMKVSRTSQTTQSTLESTNDCPLFQDLTCLIDTIYSGVAGGDPGNSINQRHLLLNETAENFLLYSTSTAASVFSNDQCSFCLHFDTRKPEQSYQGVSYLNIERFSILTPPFFPWIHDTSEKIGYFQNSQFIIAGELSNQTTDMSYFKARIKRLQGVTVTMFAYSELHCLADNDNDETFHESVNSKQAPEWSFQAKCIRLSWEPNKTYDEETGFLIEIQEVEKEKEKAKGKSLAWIWIASVVTGIICTIICIVGYKTRLFIRLFRSKDAKRDEKFGVFMNIYRKAKSIDRNQSKWEIDPSSLVVTSKKLGSGSFAVVYEGLLKEIPQSFDNFLRMKLNPKSSIKTETRVAVKMCHPHANREDKAEMLREIEFMIGLDVHSHLLCLLACSTDPLNPLIITEICEKGDLLSLLRKPKDEHEITSRDLPSIAWQISDALVFLTGKNVIHRDIAARNVLITDKNLAKLADFGLCRRSTSLLYTAKGGRLPVKWMAPESLRTAEFTEKTDLWSFGVFLWELYTFGDSPYVSLDPADMFEHLKEGNRLEFPEDTSEEIKKISSQCWQFESTNRPDIQTICSLLYKNLETGDLRYGYLDFHKESVQQNENDRKKST